MLQGDLGDFTLPDILQLLAYTRKSGRLALRRVDAVGRVDFLDGRVRDASADAAHLPLARRMLGSGLVDGDTLQQLLRTRAKLPTDVELGVELVETGAVDNDLVGRLIREQTVDAVFDLLRWTEGAFRFDAAASATKEPDQFGAAIAVEDLLQETTTRLDSWPAVAERTGPGGAVVTISRPADGGKPPNVDPDGWALLGLIDGRRTVDNLVALSGQGQFRTRRTLAALLDEGVVAIGASGPSALERLLEEHAGLADMEASLAGSDGGLEWPAREVRATAEVAARDEPAPNTPEPAASSDEAASTEESVVSTVEPEGDVGRVASSVGSVGDDEPGEASDGPPPNLAEPAAGTVGPVQEVDPVAADAPSDDIEPVSTPADDDVEPATDDDNAGDVTPLPSGPRDMRLRTDPSVDAELIERLIDGVESL